MNPWVGPDRPWRRELRSISPPVVSLREKDAPNRGRAPPPTENARSVPVAPSDESAVDWRLVADADRPPLTQLVDLVCATVDSVAHTRPGAGVTEASLHVLLGPLLRSVRIRVQAEAQARARLDAENAQLKAVLDEMTALAHDQRVRLERSAADVSLLTEQLAQSERTRTSLDGTAAWLLQERDFLQAQLDRYCGGRGVADPADHRRLPEPAETEARVPTQGGPCTGPSSPRPLTVLAVNAPLSALRGGGDGGQRLQQQSQALCTHTPPPPHTPPPVPPVAGLLTSPGFTVPAGGTALGAGDGGGRALGSERDDGRALEAIAQKVAALRRPSHTSAPDAPVGAPPQQPPLLPAPPQAAAGPADPAETAALRASLDRALRDLDERSAELRFWREKAARSDALASSLQAVITTQRHALEAAATPFAAASARSAPLYPADGQYRRDLGPTAPPLPPAPPLAAPTGSGRALSGSERPPKPPSRHAPPLHDRSRPPPLPQSRGAWREGGGEGPVEDSGGYDAGEGSASPLDDERPELLADDGDGYAEDDEGEGEDARGRDDEEGRRMQPAGRDTGGSHDPWQLPGGGFGEPDDSDARDDAGALTPPLPDAPPASRAVSPASRAAASSADDMDDIFEALAGGRQRSADGTPF